ncbi:MAG: hypothetical protein AVDCRST_MAG27-1042, partial [uncultured Craurococcus sp.]
WRCLRRRGRPAGPGRSPATSASADSRATPGPAARDARIPGRGEDRSRRGTRLRRPRRSPAGPSRSGSGPEAKTRAPVIISIPLAPHTISTEAGSVSAGDVAYGKWTVSISLPT